MTKSEQRNAPVAVPDKHYDADGITTSEADMIWNACIDEVLRLNSGSEPAVKPVKLPEALLPANHRSGEAFMAADSEGNYLNREFTIKAIRAAGGEIEE
ncbi:hypothetical protein PMPD1_3140 [Paramixta manurensis]|uniref:Uncharacterized protein n=1 Tax=Paramixta manurensis TaxID=2740817 RepID=A0A6M8UJY2_9GAMM|nr:hypothetical protein PMPD1_3140 [Erwiniaceae bacterium PD-1]